MKLNSLKAASLVAVLLFTATLTGSIWGEASQTSNSQASAAGQAPAASPAPAGAVPSGASAPANSTSNSAQAAPQSADSAPVASVKMTLPPPLSSALYHARESYRIGNFDAAVTEYQAIIAAAGPDVAGAYAGLARVYLKKRNPADAFAAAQKSVALDAHLAAAHTALGEVYFRQGKMAEAEQEFQTPLKEKIADARAFLGMSRISLANSNYRISKIAIDQAHALDAADPDIRLAWIGTLNSKDRLKAIQDYLAMRTDSDPEKKADLQHALVVLQDEANRPVHGCQLKTNIAATQTGMEQLRIDASSIRAYGLKVKINDTVARLMLDTGAGGILLNSKVAQKAGVQRVVESKVGGIGDKGAVGGYIGYASSIQIGDLQFQNCYVEVVENKGPLDDDGLIGADVFAHFLVDIDFPNEKFKLSELPKRPEEPAEAASLNTSEASAYHPHDRYIAPEMASYTRIYRFGHMLLIPTSVNEHPTKLVLIDTGAFDNTITLEAARETTKLYGNDYMVVQGISGKVKKVYDTADVMLAFAHFKDKKSIVAFDLTNISDSAGTEISGVLGFGMLYLLDIKIDYRDGLVDFGYDPNRFH